MEISDVHKNTKLMVDGKLYAVEEAEFVKPGKGRAVYHLKLKNMTDGTTIERNYRSGDKVEGVNMRSQEEQYLYREGDHYVFMDTKTFEQHHVPEDLIGDKKNFLREGMLVTVQTMGDSPIDVTLPNFVEMKVVDSEVTTRTATVTPQMKTSVLETGYVIETPSFIKEGDTIRVDTRSGTYVERVTAKK
ncbi:MAG: elongation factor P [Chloroflexota bacterium]